MLHTNNSAAQIFTAFDFSGSGFVIVFLDAFAPLFDPACLAIFPTLLFEARRLLWPKFIYYRLCNTPQLSFFLYHSWKARLSR